MRDTDFFGLALLAAVIGGLAYATVLGVHQALRSAL